MAFCSNCGKEIPVGSKFCTVCGTPAPDTVQEAANEVQNAAPPVQVSITEPSKKMGPLVGIIAMVLGAVGLFIHVTWPSVILSLVALILGTICLSKKSKLYGFAIAAIVLAVLNLLTYVVGYESANKELTALKESYSLSSPAANNSGTKTEKPERKQEEAKERKEDTAGVDPDLVAFLDSYEDFVDKYCEILTKYYENPTDFSILADYTSIMQEYAEFAEKVEAYDSDKMSAADAAYYLEVTTRCSQKMLGVVGEMGDH
ncbi:MAG: zinc-ribbon domain-containing protein [Butyrivibrio sp.]|nr:zinc-ribbon domain-containing protein [Butyrivibrio sp.]